MSAKIEITLKEEAQILFENHIKNNITSFGTNIWRTTWALDTLVNYFTIVDSSSAQETITTLLNGGLLNAMNGDWWDDYGWNGIASLRLVEKLDLNSTDKSTLVKNAINCWCYMNGPGWKTSTETHFNVPFPEVLNWQELISNNASGNPSKNLGAPNVYSYWEKSKPNNWKDLEPRFSPGGIWNTTSVPQHMPTPKKQACGAKGQLAGIQNTVTNTIFTVLSLRVYQLSQDSNYSQLFTDNDISSNAIYTAWENQMKWLDNWFQPDENASPGLINYLQTATPLSSVLIRERVPRMSNGYWGAGFCRTLSWLGDQGLLLGALREGWELWKASGNSSNSFDLIGSYNLFINGVTDVLWSKNGYNNPASPVLRPWVQYDSNTGVASFNDFPEGDNLDYETGIAVFNNYLLQAIESGTAIPETLKSNTKNLSDMIGKGFFSSSFYTICDGLIPRNEGGANGMTPWINQLSVICLALQLDN